MLPWFWTIGPRVNFQADCAAGCTFELSGLQGIRIEVLMTEIKDQEGNVVQVIG